MASFCFSQHHAQSSRRRLGLEQFVVGAQVDDLNCFIAGSEPYELEFDNNDDVICLLLGDIHGHAQFNDDAVSNFTFSGGTCSFHPGGGRVQVRASEVRQGFIAFSFPTAFQERATDIGISSARVRGSLNNIRGAGIAQISQFARARISRRTSLEPLELQSIAGLVYLETLRLLDSARAPAAAIISDLQFAKIADYVEAEIGGAISCEAMALNAGISLRALYDGMKVRTGFSPYRFVLERRVSRAVQMLLNTREPIAQIAFSCGYSSQQHLSSSLSRMLGTTPSAIRETSRASASSFQ